MTNTERSALIARVCHEANLAYCHSLGDTSQLPWDLAEQWQRDSALVGVMAALEGATPEQLHQLWCETKVADGWQYGPVKNAGAKTHPCLIPYDGLPEAQRLKDRLFRDIVMAMDAHLPRVD